MAALAMVISTKFVYAAARALRTSAASRRRTPTVAATTPYDATASAAMQADNPIILITARLPHHACDACCKPSRFAAQALVHVSRLRMRAILRRPVLVRVLHHHAGRLEDAFTI